MIHWKKVSLQVVLGSGFLLAAPITCNSILDKPKDDGYDYTYESGSFLPKKIKKGETDDDSNTGKMSADQFDKERARITQVQGGGN